MVPGARVGVIDGVSVVDGVRDGVKVRVELRVIVFVRVRVKERVAEIVRVNDGVRVRATIVNVAEGVRVRECVAVAVDSGVLLGVTDSRAAVAVLVTLGVIDEVAVRVAV